MTTQLVVLESPFRPIGPWTSHDTLHYARRSLRDSIRRGESPLCSHLLYTQVLNDQDEGERALGISLGLVWLHHADLHVFYTDLGWSPGMISSLRNFTLKFSIPFSLRSLDAPVCLPADISPETEAILIGAIENFR